MNKILIILILLIFTISLFASKAQEEYNTLSKEYHLFFKSKNKRSDWLKLIKKFEEHSERYKSSNTSAKSLYNVANLSYKIYKISHRQSDQNKALNSYKELCLNYKSSSLSDDSCVFLYQFYFKKAKNYEKSKKYAGFLLKNYPKSDNYQITKKFVKKNFPNLLKEKKSTGVLKSINNKYLTINFFKEKLIVSIKSKSNESAKIGEVKIDGELKKVFIDLKNEQFKKLKPININFILKQVRFGQYKTDVGRIVFDFKNKAKYKILDRGKTLIISFKNNNKVHEIKTKEIIKLDEPEEMHGRASQRENEKRTSQRENEKRASQRENEKRTSQRENEKHASQRENKNNAPQKDKEVKEKDIQKDKSLSKKKYIIIIDPGHGGKDPGATTKNKKHYEKDIALSIALKLEKKLKKNKKYKIILTRRTDKFLTLDQRTDIANDNKGDIFISIHVNAIANSKFYGIETFYLNIAADNYSRRLESVENAENQKKITDLQFILADLLKKANTKESIDLAKFVQSSIIYNLRRKYKSIKNLGVKNAMFYVLLDTKMPSVLVETGFITNNRDSKRLINPKYQEKLAVSIVKGINKFFSKYKKRK